MVWLVKVIIQGETGAYAFLEERYWLIPEYEADLSTTQGKLDAYVVCIYFVTVTVTTVRTMSRFWYL